MVKSVAEIEANPYDRPMTEEELLKTVKDVEGLIVSTDDINRKALERAKKLKIIARHGVGVDNIDMKAATEKSIVVTYTPSANAESVADFTMGLMLSLARRIPQAHASTKQGMWEAGKFMGAEVYGKTLGIIGLGTIGTGVVRRAKGFDMRILYYDKIRKTHLEEELEVRCVNLKTLLRESRRVKEGPIHHALQGGIEIAWNRHWHSFVAFETSDRRREENLEEKPEKPRRYLNNLRFLCNYEIRFCILSNSS